MTSLGLRVVGAGVLGSLGSHVSVLEDIVQWNLLLKLVHDSRLGHVVVTDRDGVSGEHPHVLLSEEGADTDARVEQGEVVVISVEDFVVAGGDGGNELNLEVSVVLGGVDLEGSADTAAPDALLVVPVVVADADVVGLVTQGVGGSVAVARLVVGVLVADHLVPEAQVSLNVQVLHDVGLLALAVVDGGVGGTDHGEGCNKQKIETNLACAGLNSDHVVITIRTEYI